MGEDSCSSHTTKEGSESTLLVATLRSLFVPQTEHCHQQKVEKRNSLASCPAHTKLNHARKKSTSYYSVKHAESLGTRLR